MSFLWPVMLLLLLFLPLLVWLYLRQQQRRHQLTAHFGLVAQNPAAATPTSRWQHLPALLFLLGLILLMLAVARPQAVVSLPRIEGTVILAFDVSGSMAAEDLEPTRMEAAKAAARTFIEQQPPDILIGVVAFSDSGFTVQPPTEDREAIFTTINRLTPERGTALGSGILASLNALTADADEADESFLYSDLTPVPTPTPTPMPDGTFTSAVIVLLSDGENNEMPDPLAAAQTAADRGVRIHTVGIGSSGGTTLEVEGFLVHTQLDEEMLQEIAQITDGNYYNAANEADLQAIYANLQPELVTKPEEMEVTSLLAGISIPILLLGGALSLWWFSRLP
jgi:Ca-activated chloride channel family protein